MSNIQQNLAKILSSRYGRDVRQSIHDAIEESHSFAVSASGGQDLIDAIAAARDEIEGYKDVAAAAATQLAAGLLRPKGTYANLAALNAGTPTVADTDEIYITLDDGKWCYWNGTAFVAGGVYQAASIAADIDNLITQLAQTGQQVDGSFNNVFKSTKGWWNARPLISFTDDDGTQAMFDRLVPLFIAKGVPLTVALYGGSYALTKQSLIRQLLDLQNDHNWEIVSHTENHDDLTTLTEGQIRADSENWLSVLRGHGFNVESIFYPHGTHNDLTIKALSEYYRSGWRATTGADTGNRFNETTDYFQTMRMRRVPFGYDSTTTFNDYKIIVDNAVANKEWLVFISHAWDPRFDNNQLAILGQLIDYIKSLSVDIVNIRDGLNYYQPLLSAGRYTYNAEYPFIDIFRDGTVYSKYAMEYKMLDSVTAQMTRDDFINRLTVFNVSSEGSTDFPGAGTVIMIKGHAFGYDTQIWFDYYSSRTMRRRATSATTWGGWEGEILPLNTYTASALITEYPNGITTFPVNTTNGEGFPRTTGTSSAGLVTTYKIQATAWYRQEYRLYNSAETWIRFVKSDGTWSTWIRVGGGFGTSTQKPPLVDVPFGYMYYDTTLGKALFKRDGNTWYDAMGAWAAND